MSTDLSKHTKALGCIPEVDEQLQPFFDRPENGLAGAAVMAVNKQGRVIYQGTFGKRSLDPAADLAPVTLDTVFWIGMWRKDIHSIRVCSPSSTHPNSIIYKSESNKIVDCHRCHAMRRAWSD